MRGPDRVSENSTLLNQVAALMLVGLSNNNVEKPLYGHMARALTVAWAINALLVLGFLELQVLQAIS